MKFLVLILLGGYAGITTLLVDLKGRVEYLEDNLKYDKEFWGDLSEN